MNRPPSLKWSERETESAYVANPEITRVRGIAFAVCALFFGAISLLNYFDPPASRHGEGDPIMLLLIFLLAVVPFSYGALVGLVNTTQIVIDAQGFRMMHGPIWQIGNLREPLQNIDGFEVTIVERKHTVASGVRLRTASGGGYDFFMFGDATHAQYVAQRLTQVVKAFQAKSHGPYR